MTVLGVRIANATKEQAIELMGRWIREGRGRAHGVYIVNAHTLNLAYEDPAYRNVLNEADVVFGDGTGVRIAARQRDVAMADNLVGTDLIPELMRTSSGQGFRYFLLGGRPGVAERAADRLRDEFPGIRIAGCHPGYVDEDSSRRAVDLINRSEADVLLVAMGNPLQEQWIHAYRPQLAPPVCVGVGGLFDHWAGNLKRAPQWLRDLGLEWTQILLQQPALKWRRYLLGNPKFLARSLRGRSSDLVDRSV